MKSQEKTTTTTNREELSITKNLKKKLRKKTKILK